MKQASEQSLETRNFVVFTVCNITASRSLIQLR